MTIKNDACHNHKRSKRHFKKHFNKENINHIKTFITGAKRLNRKITAKEVKIVVWKMANNKAPGKDNINVELIKYAPEDIRKILSKIFMNTAEDKINKHRCSMGLQVDGC